ncbi:MAG: hypothetical protein IJ423_04285 [Clostridia bacterium]|nr:hypothetical protein [Clostridia bacterium]
MKRFWLFACMALATLFVLTCVFFALFHNNLHYDNATDKHNLVNTTYSISEIESLKKEFENRQSANKAYKFSELKRNFEVECVRKSFGGYYVILFLDNGSEAFIFFNEDLEMFNVMIFDRFLSVKDFESLYRLTDILELDPNAERLDTSVGTYVHVVQEGVLRIQYGMERDGTDEVYFDSPEVLWQYLDEHIDDIYNVANETTFWKNSELNGDEYFIGKGSAYILEIDKYID